MMLAASLLSFALAAVPSTPVAPLAHVRTASGRLAEVIAYGAERSALMRQLLDTLDRSVLLVYVVEGRCSAGSRFACTQLIVGSQARQLQIRINPGQNQRTVLGLVAHELQHAVEIAGAADVTDAASLRRLYQRIGYRNCSPNMDECWETTAAQDAEREVVQQAMRSARLVHESFVGDWFLDVEASIFRGLDAPQSGRRFHRRQGFGLLSVVSEMVREDGTEQRDGFVYRPDGRDYRVGRDGEADLLSITATALDSLTTTFTVSSGATVLSTGRSTLDPRRATLTIETHGTEAQGSAWTSIEIWRKAAPTSTSASTTDRLAVR